jgi:hypothetical protein
MSPPRCRFIATVSGSTFRGSASSVAAWSRRIQSGEFGGTMVGMMNQFGRATGATGEASVGTVTEGSINRAGGPRALPMFADWTDRVAAGQFPKQAPPRPKGVERNIVKMQLRPNPLAK